MTVVAKPWPSQVVMVSSPPGAAAPGCEDGEAEEAGEEEAVRGPCGGRMLACCVFGGNAELTWAGGPQRALRVLIF